MGRVRAAVVAYGEALAAARQAAGLSQHGLAKAAGVDASYVNRLERGDRQPPDEALTRRFAVALGLGPEQADALVVAGGGLPAALARLGPLDPSVLLLADILADPAIPQQERDDLRRILVLLARRWRPALVAGEQELSAAGTSSAR